MAITAYKITGINQFNQPDAIAFILSKNLKFTEDTRGGIKKCLTYPNYVYLTKLEITQDEIDTASFTITIVTLTDGWYKNVSDYKLEVPYEVNGDDTIKYLRVMPGEIILPTDANIKVLLTPFLKRVLLINQVTAKSDGVWFTGDGDWQTGQEDWWS